MVYSKGAKPQNGASAEAELEKLHAEFVSEQQKRIQLERELGEERQKSYQISCRLEVAQQEIFQLRMQHNQDQSLIIHKTSELQAENDKLKAELSHYEHFSKVRPEELMRIRRENAIKAAEQSLKQEQEEMSAEIKRKETRHIVAIAEQARIRAARKNPGKSYYERHAIDED